MTKKRMIWLSVPVMIVALVYYAMFGGSYVPPTVSAGPITGYVVEEGSRQPLEGVQVVARWKGTIAYSHTVCFHVANAVTDAEGQYHIPAWSKKHRYGNSDNQQMPITIYKAGYRWTDTVSREPFLAVLAPDTGSHEQRLKYLLGVSPGCGTKDESEKNLLPLIKATYEEAKSIATTKEDMKTLEFILYNIEKIEMEFEIAQERHLKRNRALK